MLLPYISYPRVPGSRECYHSQLCTVHHTYRTHMCRGVLAFINYVLYLYGTGSFRLRCLSYKAILIMVRYSPCCCTWSGMINLIHNCKIFYKGDCIAHPNHLSSATHKHNDIPFIFDDAVVGKFYLRPKAKQFDLLPKNPDVLFIDTGRTWRTVFG